MFSSKTWRLYVWLIEPHNLTKWLFFWVLQQKSMWGNEQLSSVLFSPCDSCETNAEDGWGHNSISESRLFLSVLSQWSWMVINSEKKDLYGLVGLKIIFVALDTHFNQVWFIWSSAAYFNIDKLWSLQSRDTSRCQDDNFDRICPLRSFVHHVKFEG